MSQRSVLIIYTGGTIGMLADPRTGALRAMDLTHLEEQVPELGRMGVRLGSVAFEKPIDSSDMRPTDWVRIARIIGDHYAEYDGFVVLHGSDTMAYTASALSFLLEGLAKPVILTGSQLPIGTIRTDAKENLITAIEIATAYEGDRPLVPEVAVYFEYGLYRGNRTVKVHAERFEAFRSPNWPRLAEAGVRIKYDRASILPLRTGPLKVHQQVDDRVAVLRLFPGITPAVVGAVLAVPGLRGCVLETYGSGNAPTAPWFLACLAEARQRGVWLLNVSQCEDGRVVQGTYETSSSFAELGIVGGDDITTEAAVTKLMFVLGLGLGEARTRELLGQDLRGEITP